MDVLQRKKDLGAAIRRAREAQGLSQRKFALIVGLGQPYLSAVESGACNIGYENLCRIADALDMRVRDLTDPEDATA